jgi:hypothetical protein
MSTEAAKMGFGAELPKGAALMGGAGFAMLGMVGMLARAWAEAPVAETLPEVVLRRVSRWARRASAATNGQTSVGLWMIDVILWETYRGSRERTKQRHRAREKQEDEAWSRREKALRAHLEKVGAL